MNERLIGAKGTLQPGCAVLVVEDHPLLGGRIVEFLLATFSGCHCILCRSGEEAVEVARAQKIDAILMDIGLPGINGIVATREIKAFAPSIPVVMLTTHGKDLFEAMARAAGATHYVVKEAMYEELVPVLAGLLKCPAIRSAA